jgi:acetoacetyl-CoA reductase
MHGFTKALALEVARKGVTVNTISPGYIGTKMVGLRHRRQHRD